MIYKPFNINADLAEGFNIEESIMPYIDSCNLACGGHSGDLILIKKVVAIAQKNHVKIGAHPSYPDKENFGRKVMKLTISELYQSIRNQIKLLLEVIPIHELHHVKPHGALYHSCIADIKTASVFLDVIKEVCPKTIIFTLPNSQLEKLANKNGITVWREAFMDRVYLEDGKLLPRSETGSIHNTIENLYHQFYYLIHEQKVLTIEKSWIDMKSDTICIHGDHANSVTNLITILNLYNQKRIPNE